MAVSSTLFAHLHARTVITELRAHTTHPSCGPSDCGVQCMQMRQRTQGNDSRSPFMISLSPACLPGATVLLKSALSLFLPFVTFQANMVQMTRPRTATTTQMMTSTIPSSDDPAPAYKASRPYGTRQAATGPARVRWRPLRLRSITFDHVRVAARTEGPHGAHGVGANKTKKVHTHACPCVCCAAPSSSLAAAFLAVGAGVAAVVVAFVVDGAAVAFVVVCWHCRSASALPPTPTLPVGHTRQGMHMGLPEPAGRNVPGGHVVQCRSAIALGAWISNLPAGQDARCGVHATPSTL